MPTLDFRAKLEAKVVEQLGGQRLAYLLGAGSSHLNGLGYPLSFELWERIKSNITDVEKRADIQAKLDNGAAGIEQALDALDNGDVAESPHRHLVVSAIAQLFEPLAPPLDHHARFLSRLSQKPDRCKVFSLNYDPLLERAAEASRVRLIDGFVGHEHAYFDPAIFEERVGRIRGTYRSRQFEETAGYIHLHKLHGSLGWYDCSLRGIRRCQFTSSTPWNTRRLMVPPQRRKANDTMTPPYAALWSAFRGCLGQDAVPMNRLAVIGYGFRDEHVNAVIESALARANFTLLIFTKELDDVAWARWSAKSNVIAVTNHRCSLNREMGPGHADLWSFERLSEMV